ncbi:MAG: S8 family serine peptidase, partial [Propionibacteriaceae bacterium]|nr:S8 family serine peptidase [Propionibacteriaceae bacterium]
MSAHPRRRALLGIAAGATITALFATTLAVPAGAAPTAGAAKLKLGDAANQSRVIEGRYLVETVGTPQVQGGSKARNQAGIAATKASAKAVGAKVGSSYSKLWTGVSVTATDAQIAQLSRSASVTAIYPVLSVPMPETTVTKTQISNEIATVSAEDTGLDGTGIKVGIIDTGIDYTNPDLGGASDFPSTRVAYGTDLVGDDYDSSGDNGSTTPVPDPDPMDCAGHGTHVAGIVGADGDPDIGGAVGVATNVTFGAYKVFGCEGSTDTAVILDAMDLALTDEMDVVNMSLGSDFDSWPSYPDAVAASNLTKAGVVVVAAAGNSGDTGLFSAGSPGVGSGVISVASYESETIRTKVIAVGDTKIAYTQVEYTAEAPADNSTTTLSLASNTDACAQPATVAGGALLVKRGTCSFNEKIANAVAAGADAVVIYNNVPGLASFTTGGTTYVQPAIGISGQDGDALAAKIADEGPQTMTWMDYQQDVPNPDGGALSTFSSAGLAADLSLVPTITAPGGKIYSTLPMDQGGHGNMSGTSMASPFVAGAAALLLQADDTLLPGTVAQKLYNTAVPVTTATETRASGSSLSKYPEAVFRQGSGLVNIAGALSAGVTASPSTIKLGEGYSQKVKITLTNTTSETLTYKPYRVSGVSAAASTNSSSNDSVGTTTPLYDYGSVWFRSYKESITVKAGKSASIYVR